MASTLAPLWFINVEGVSSKTFSPSISASTVSPWKRDFTVANSVSLRQFADDDETDIVPSSLVAPSRIAQPYDEFHVGFQCSVFSVQCSVAYRLKTEH